MLSYQLPVTEPSVASEPSEGLERTFGEADGSGDGFGLLTRRTLLSEGGEDGTRGTALDRDRYSSSLVVSGRGRR
jgi:hypothetical protein